MIVITETKIDRKLTPQEELEARHFMAERLQYMVYIDQSDPTVVTCHWTSLDVANELVARTATYDPPIITTIVSEV